MIFFWIWLIVFVLLCLVQINVTSLLYVLKRDHSEIHLKLKKYFGEKNSFCKFVFKCLDEPIRYVCRSSTSYTPDADLFFVLLFFMFSVWFLFLLWFLAGFIVRRYTNFIARILETVLPSTKPE